MEITVWRNSRKVMEKDFDEKKLIKGIVVAGILVGIVFVGYNLLQPQTIRAAEFLKINPWDTYLKLEEKTIEFVAELYNPAHDFNYTDRLPVPTQLTDNGIVKDVVKPLSTKGWEIWAEVNKKIGLY